MIGLISLAAALLSTTSAIHFEGEVPVQFYYTDGANGTVELWTANGGTWTSALDPSKTMPAPADADSRKAVDILVATDGGIFWVDNTPSHEGLLSPVLFLEGLDFYDESPLDGNGAHRDLTAQGLLSQLYNQEISFPLCRRGHDVVTLNYQHSGIDIRRNGEFAAQVLYWMVSNLAVGSASPKVVGVSMGGVVGRWAVHRYETGLRTAALPKVGLYISLDAPHQGANVPLSVKNLIVGLDGFGSDAATVLNNILNNSQASKQLLLRQDETGPAQEYLDFQSEYSSCRSLPGTRQVAITNGSLIGTAQEYLPEDGFSDAATKRAFKKDPMKLWRPLSTALAGVNSFSISRMAEWGFFNTTVLSVILNGGVDQANPSYYLHLGQSGILSGLYITMSGSWSSPIPYDLAPGGFFPFFSMIYSQVNAGVDKAIQDNDLYSARDQRSLESGHACFIPTVSAIDYRTQNGSAAIGDNSLVFANLKSLDADIARHTSFNAVYGIDEASLSNSPSGRNVGFWRNQLHILGKSEDNAYRIVCEVDYVDGRISDPSTCAHSSNDPSYASTVYQTINLQGNNGPPAWTAASGVNDRFTYPSSSDPFIANHQDALVWQGTPVLGWHPVYSLPYLVQANDQISVDVYVPPASYGYLSMSGVLQAAADGCGYYQLPQTTLNTTAGGWQTLTWTVPPFYNPQCETSGGDDVNSSFQLILNAPVVGNPLKITGLRLVRNGGSVTTIPPLPPAKSQIVPIARAAAFSLGTWGNHDADYEDKGYLNVVFDSPWTGAVFYNNAGRDISGYRYLEVEAKGSVPSSQSRMMIFLDDHPDVTDQAYADGWHAPISAYQLYGKGYNYWGSMPLVSRSQDGFETRRVPISWLTENGTMSKIILQHATWNGKPNETWEIRSMKFTN